jgi:arylsulfatase
MVAKAKTRPNIVVITADQWRGDCMGSRGGRHPVMTPHVDQLAAEGANFTQAYADCPVCMPQRVTMLTGQVASHFGLPGNFNVRSPIDPQSSLPAQLSGRAGYQTKAIGKMHFMPGRARMGFEHITLHPNDYVNFLEETPYAGMYRGHGLGGNEVYPAVAPMPQRFTHTVWIVDQAIRFLGQRDPENPFFLWIVFESPHSPFDPPQPYDRMYDNFTIPEPIQGDWVNTPDDPAYFRAKRLVGKWGQLSEELIAESRRRYYGLISHIDYELGRFLGELRSKGLYDDTAIIFNADHGEHLGDHGLFGKTTFLTGSGDVPFVIRLPASHAMAEPTLEFDNPILTADLYPTVLELAGLEPNPECDGISLLPALASGEMPERTICGECSHGDDTTAFATDGRHKLIYYFRGGVEQLFDVDKDRENLHNLAHLPDYEEAKDGLKATLLTYLSGFDRPLVADGGFAIGDADLDEKQLRANNPWAWRGPMRWGQGYGGGW